MIEQLLDWSDPKEVQTKYGPRILRKAEPTEKFWQAWREKKDQLKAAGLSCGKSNYTGEWEVTWWQELTTEIKQERAQAIEQSRAVSAEISLPHPDGLDYMPFQKAGIRYALERKGVLIGDDMGLGKTIQAIGIINASPDITSAAIVCPKSLKLNWYNELKKWLTRDLTIAVCNGAWTDADIVILNYESVKKHQDKLSAKTWGCVIVDEAHFIKNPKAQRSQAVKAIPTIRKIRLTGTPIVNRPAELYNIIEDLSDGWGSFFGFAKRYCDAHYNGFGWDYSGAQNLDELQRRLRETIMVRRLKSEVLTELPRKIRQVIELEPETAGQRRAVSSETRHEVASEERLSNLRAAVELSKAESDEAYQAAVQRLQDASRVDFTEMARLRHETALEKLPLVVDFVRNALEDDEAKKIVIIAHHHDMIDGLANALLDFYPVILTGETKDIDRQSAVDRFQTESKTRVFIGSIQAAGVGITLTAASHVIFSELDWVPGNVSQAEDRCHRIGQTETVLIQHLVLAESIDARMAKIIVEKQQVIDSALDVNHPERTMPVFVPKKSAATHETKPDKITQLAEKITDEQIAVIHSGLHILAGMDWDHAQDQNGMGFNKIDNQIGHSLANAAKLTPKQAVLGAKVIQKYHGQLPDEINQIAREVWQK